MTRKIVVVLMALLCLNYALAYAQNNGKVTLHLSNTSVKEVLRQMQQQTGKIIGYQSKDVESLAAVQFDCSNKPLDAALKQLLENTGLTYVIRDNNVVIKRKKDASAESIQAQDTTINATSTSTTMRSISGRVINADQQGIPGATVQALASKKMAFTNDNGEYFIQVPTDENMLTFSSIGFEHTNVMLHSNKQYTVQLKERAGNLRTVEVVSTGYVNLPKERATGSFGVVTSKQLEMIPVPNILNRLEGQVPGVQLNLTESDNSFVYGNLMNDGAGKSSYTMTVRGTSTLNNDVNSQPLVVIDGFPTKMDLRTLNPNDVEQVTFLKDAAAASIWGAQASAGVVVITTKKGKVSDGAPHISFTAGYGFNGKPRLKDMPLMNSSQMINYQQELISKGYLTDPFYQSGQYQTATTSATALIFQNKRGEITDQQLNDGLAVLEKRDSRDQVLKYLLRPANQQHYDLNISGGTDKHTYYLSGAYDKENTSTNNTSGERITLTANQDFKLFKVATLSTNLRGSWFRYTTGGPGLGVYSNTLTTLMPYDQLVDDNGKSVNYARAYNGDRLTTLENSGYMPWRYNYINEQSMTDDHINEANYAATVGLSIPIYRGLTFNAQYMVERTSDQHKVYNSDSSYYTRNLLNNATSIDGGGNLVYGIPLGGVLNMNSTNRNNYSVRGQLAYDRNIAAKHQINALAGMETRQTIDGTDANTLYGYNTQTQFSKPVDYATYYTDVNGYAYNSLNYNNAYTSQRRRFLSYFGNFAYTYNGKYTVSGSARYDDYNNFGLNRKYRAKPFWSAGASWAITKEKFMQDATWLNNLTLRATYGINGNINPNALPYDQLALIPPYQVPFDPYAIIKSPANPALTWEQTGIYNLGLDYSILDYRLSGSVEAYYKKGTNLFATFPIDNTSGFDNLTRNTATLNGKGLDVSVTGKIIRSKDFEWTATALFAYNTNKVTDARFNVTTGLLASGGLAGPIKGYSTDYYMVFRYAGLDKTGAPLVLNGKGDSLTIYQSPSNIGDLKNAGHLIPPYFGSISQTFRYKSFSLFIMATYKFGYVFMRPTPTNYPSRWGLTGYDYNNIIDKRWRKAGDEATTNVPGLASSSIGQIRYANSDLNVLPGDHIRLREVSLSYTVPASLYSRLPIKGISLTGAARNLAILWKKNDAGIDPDFPPTVNNMKLPPSATFNFSLNVNF